jgi:hypothetical protein
MVAQTVHLVPITLANSPQSHFCGSIIDKLWDVGIDKSLFAQVSKLSIAANNAVGCFKAF